MQDAIAASTDHLKALSRHKALAPLAKRAAAVLPSSAGNSC
jgi:hypothetical protein